MQYIYNISGLITHFNIIRFALAVVMRGRKKIKDGAC